MMKFLYEGKWWTSYGNFIVSHSQSIRMKFLKIILHLDFHLQYNLYETTFAYLLAIARKAVVRICIFTLFEKRLDVLGKTLRRLGQNVKAFSFKHLIVATQGWKCICMHYMEKYAQTSEAPCAECAKSHKNRADSHTFMHP